MTGAGKTKGRRASERAKGGKHGRAPGLGVCVIHVEDVLEIL